MNKPENQAVIDAMVAQFKLSDTIRADLEDSSNWSIEVHKKQPGRVRVTGQRSTGAKFNHIVPWVRNGV